MTNIDNRRQERLEAIARLFEEAQPFDSLDLDDFDHIPPGDPAGGDLPAPAPQPRKHRLDAKPWSFDRAAWPYRYWLRLHRLARLDQSDTDNATRLLAHFGKDVLVRRQEGGREPIFVTWADTHWDDVSGKFGAQRIAQKIGDLIKAEAAMIGPTKEEREKITRYEAVKNEPTDKQDLEAKMIFKEAAAAMDAVAARKKRRTDFGVSCKNGNRIREMLSQASPKILIDPDRFNADPLKVATPTQTISWEREEDLECPDPDVVRLKVRLSCKVGHNRADLITSVLPVSYDAEAAAPKFMAFLARFMPDLECRRFLQASCGVGLLGFAPQVLVFHYGEGANGKSVFLEVISRVLGDLAAGMPSEALTGDEQSGGLKPSPEIARLFGKRWVRISEIKEGVPLQEAFVKKLTGSETFPARNLFEGYFEFKPQFIAHMSGNGYPKISGTDNGIWRRMRVLKWPVTLADDEQRDFDEVVGEMVAEAPGILRWLVEGASIFLQEGLVSPASVAMETGEMRDRMDPVKRFVESCIIFTSKPDDTVAGGVLYRAYHEWAEASGDHNPVSLTRFGRDIIKHKGIVKDTRGQLRLYRGIQLRAEPRSPADAWDTHYGP